LETIMTEKKTDTAAKAAAKTTDTPIVAGVAPALDTSTPAAIPAATDFSTSGAPRQVTDIEVDHPAVDNDPRAGTTVDQNRIDFNDPTLDGAEAVQRNLEAQAKA
jgi:hypothetical protein